MWGHRFYKAKARKTTKLETLGNPKAYVHQVFPRLKVLEPGED